MLGGAEPRTGPGWLLRGANSRAKPELRARSAPELRAKPEKKRGEGSGEGGPSPEIFSKL